MAAPMNAAAYFCRAALRAARSSCLLAALAALPCAAYAQEAAPGCAAPQAQLPVPALPGATGTDLPVLLSACSMHASASGDMEFSGAVLAQLGGRQLRCDHLAYHAATGQLDLSGAVQMADPSLRITGETGTYGQGHADFRNAQFEFLEHPGRGTAARILMPAPHHVQLIDGSYTTCPPGYADWELRARRIDLDPQGKRGTARGARVKFEGVPILYLPWISFPLTSERQTGLLFPTLGSSSRSGASLSVPWYWNIAPQRDLTLTPTYFSRRGFDIGSELRWLAAGGGGILRANFLPGDRLAHRDRDWLRLHGDQRFGTTAHLRFDAEGTSDTHYFEDFADGPQSTSITFLPRQLRLDDSGEAWKARAELLQFQTLDDQLADADRPYEELPRIVASARLPGASTFTADIDGEAANFQRGTGVTGWRARAQPALGLDFSRPGFYLRPRASWDLTTYRLRDQASGTDASPSRSAPVLSLDTGLMLERLGRGSGGWLVTLEPRAFYVYIPYRNQDALPVFDSGLPDPNYVSLFRTNRYTGHDRLGDANDLSFGLTTRMLRAATGERFLSATLGETLHLSTPRVTLPGATATFGQRSDLVADLELSAYRHWNLRYQLAWDPATSVTVKSLLAAQYRLDGGRVLNMGYRYTRGSVGQAEASAAWPVARRWDLYGRTVYSLLDQRLLEAFAGVQYRANCWGIRLVVRDSVSNRSGARDTGWYLQLELRGLSSVGSGADSFLLGAIQGYSPTATNR
jgi:LPS-assembly protein